jgi:hypothetical protein
MKMMLQSPGGEQEPLSGIAPMMRVATKAYRVLPLRSNPGAPSAITRLKAHSDSESSSGFPSGDSPRDAVTQSESKPAGAQRVAAVTIPGTMSWMKMPFSPFSFCLIEIMCFPSGDHALITSPNDSNPGLYFMLIERLQRDELWPEFRYLGSAFFRVSGKSAPPWLQSPAISDLASFILPLKSPIIIRISKERLRPSIVIVDRGILAP